MLTALGQSSSPENLLMGHRPKIGLVGSGMIGGCLAQLITREGLGDVVLFDVVDGLSQGKSLDLNHFAARLGLETKIFGTNSMADLAGSSIVVVTAGIARKPGMSRNDLTAVNSKIIKSVAGGVKQYCPDAFVICVTNPLDVMVSLFQEESGLPHCRVIGMAGTLDSCRFENFIAEELNISVTDVRAIVLGGHGDLMVPLPRFSSIAGIPLLEFVSSGLLSQNKLNEIIERTRDCGAEIVGLLKSGSAFCGPAACILEIIGTVLWDRRRILTCSTYLKGEYGHQGIYAGVPVLLGAGGVERVIELGLLPEEQAALDKSINAIKIQFQEAKL